MKNTIHSILVLSLTLGLSACQSNLPTGPAEPSTPINYESTTDTQSQDVTPEITTDSTTETDTNGETADLTAEDPNAAIIDENNSQYTLSSVKAMINDFEYQNEAIFLNCASSSLSSCQEQAAYDLAISAKADKPCDAITNDAQKTNCKNQLWTQLANIEQDPALCDNINEESQKNYCQQEALFAQATATKDADLCEQITDASQADSCRVQITTALAIESQNAALCENIVMFNYNYVFTTNEETGESTEEIVREAIADEDNYQKSDCINSVQMAIEMAEAEAAAQALQEEANQALEPAPES